MLYKDNIWLVNSATADYIIKKRKPAGLFIYRDSGRYVGIDNRTGDAWTEDFRTKLGCLAWLTDEMTTEEVHNKENSDCGDLCQDENQHKLIKEFEIAGEIITIREFGVPEYKFRIFTGTIPCGYQIWNVPKDMLQKGYIPLCRPSDRQRYPGARDIDADALLAVETEGSDVIMEAIGFGPNNLESMEMFVKKNRDAKPGSLTYNDLQRVEKALPYMRKLRWA